MIHSSLHMADVTHKETSRREATATGRIILGATAYQALIQNQVPKGDVLAAAQVAGLMAVKNTPQILPLCHPLLVEHTDLKFHMHPEIHGVSVYCTVCLDGKTGVEMEALTGAMASLLCIYDMIKPIEPALLIEKVYLLEKKGGKSGHWIHPIETTSTVNTKQNLASKTVEENKPTAINLRGRTAAVLTVSDTVSQDPSQDRSGPLLSENLLQAGFTVIHTSCIPDERSGIVKKITALLDENPGLDLIISTGGTGLSLRDVTPDAMQSIPNMRLIPGIGEILRYSGAKYTDNSWLSRSAAFQFGKTILVCLPGSPKAVAQGLQELLPKFDHMFRMIAGEKHGK